MQPEGSSFVNCQKVPVLTLVEFKVEALWSPSFRLKNSRDFEPRCVREVLVWCYQGFWTTISRIFFVEKQLRLHREWAVSYMLRVVLFVNGIRITRNLPAEKKIIISLNPRPTHGPTAIRLLIFIQTHMQPLLVLHSLVRWAHSVHQSVWFDLDKHDLQRVKSDPVVKMLPDWTQSAIQK